MIHYRSAPLRIISTLRDGSRISFGSMSQIRFFPCSIQRKRNHPPLVPTQSLQFSLNAPISMALKRERTLYFIGWYCRWRAVPAPISRLPQMRQRLQSVLTLSRPLAAVTQNKLTRNRNAPKVFFHGRPGHINPSGSLYTEYKGNLSAGLLCTVHIL